jgi:hypothetical protein
MRSAILALAVLAAIAVAASAAPFDVAASETPPFNLEVILRDATGRGGFGHVKFRQPVDPEQVVYLDTWVRDLSPNRDYALQRAVDTTLDGLCDSRGWVTLGKGAEPQTIAADDRGTGREQLFRSLAMLTAGTRFDIYFRVVPAGTSDPVLQSGCYRFTVR